MTDKEKDKFIGAHIPPSLHAKLAKSAEKSGRSISKEVFFILKAHFEKPVK